MKIICVGFNYRDHIGEMPRLWTPSENSDPTIFIKPDSAILSNDKKQFFLPDFSHDIDYEAEIVVKINKMGKNIAERFAHRYYNEITLGIDFTARVLQQELKDKGLPWEISKGFDNSAALGTFVPKETFGMPIENLNFKLDLNDNTVQQANTSQMITSVDQIISYASRFFTLKTGDLIFTGTPSGIGRVHIGDRLRGSIEGQELLQVEIC